MATLDQVRRLLGEVLQLGARVEQLDASTPLLGALPELDSMAVATVIAAIEDGFDIVVEDDEVSAETFRSVGSLSEHVDHKLAE